MNSVVKFSAPSIDVTRIIALMCGGDVCFERICWEINRGYGDGPVLSESGQVFPHMI